MTIHLYHQVKAIACSLTLTDSAKNRETPYPETHTLSQEPTMTMLGMFASRKSEIGLSLRDQLLLRALYPKRRFQSDEENPMFLKYAFDRALGR